MNPAASAILAAGIIAAGGCSRDDVTHVRVPKPPATTPAAAATPATVDLPAAPARKVVNTKAGPLKIYDFTSEGATRSRLVAGLAEAKGDTWFVKITGDADAVGAAREDFMKLLGSLRFE